MFLNKARRVRVAQELVKYDSYLQYKPFQALGLVSVCDSRHGLCLNGANS